MKDQLEAAGATVVCLNRPRPSILAPHHFMAYAYRSIRDIVRLCREHKVSVVQCHLSDAEFLGIPAALVARVPKVITTVHVAAVLPERASWSLRNILRRCYTNLLYRRVDSVIAVSDEVAGNLTKVFGIRSEKITTIINRIDTASYGSAPPAGPAAASLGLDPGLRAITTVARLVPPKGHAVLLEAARTCVSRHTGLRFLLVGDGELRGRLEMQSAALGISGPVMFLGTRVDVPEVLAASELFVLPSRSEGTSLALIEAMAAGKPIVATDIPGNAALIEHRRTGLLVPPGDAGALAEAICFLLEHRETARAYGIQARAAARERFDISRTIAELASLWERDAPGA